MSKWLCKLGELQAVYNQRWDTYEVTSFYDFRQLRKNVVYIDLKLYWMDGEPQEDMTISTYSIGQIWRKPRGI